LRIPFGVPNYHQYKGIAAEGSRKSKLQLRSKHMSFLRKTNEVLVVEEPIQVAEPVKPGPKLAAKSSANTEAAGPLLMPDFVDDLRKRWDGIQIGFVDEPKAAVRQADELVASAIKKLAESFTEARSNLESQWSRGDEANTEDLRVALKKYRTFFQKLMSV
jgi:hypothetical protein